MLKLLALLLILPALATASVSRLYVGENEGQPMAGVDTRINFGPFFVGGDIKTMIRQTVVNRDNKVVGFLPDRTDYKTSAGIEYGNFELEYAHTCYHRVISNSDLAFYENNVNPGDTDTIAVKVTF
ncbi:hypothetical protein NO1_1787 [Candidatus Termititenax aidoneus]|uniref:Uncharacterized protein n=1 Tax=Termititenax aidoneus TaxID=2218524 RepID=A0A388TCP2_TERA1|nr:hypothetical protein NO1_1787 [Candidatus Termititenax aidoneus]